MTPKEKALDMFHGGYNCAQAVFSAYADEMGLDEDITKSVAAGFGGGIADMQKTCGAVTGAIMLIGYKYYNDNEVRGSKKEVYRKTLEFTNEFDRIYGSIECGELISGIKGEKRHTCSEHVKGACEIFERITKE